MKLTCSFISNLCRKVGYSSLTIITSVLLLSCSAPTNPTFMPISPTPKLDKSSYTSFDGDSFGYLSWNTEQKLNTVIIATHGMNGAASDYRNFGEYLTQHRPNIAIYAHNTRGQGFDPNEERRGDIEQASDWYQDLHTFSNLVRTKHPEATIVWMGESMGSLITAHTAALLETQSAINYDALILSSPVISMSPNLPRWKRAALKLAASIAPNYRVSLEDLTKEDNIQITQGTDHKSQSTTNEYHIPTHSLRLLATLGKHIEQMQNKVSLISSPSLVVHGGKDIFCTPEDAENLLASFPKQTKTKQLYYPEAYHLLMYDDLREQIFSDIVSWLDQFDPQ